MSMCLTWHVPQIVVVSDTALAALLRQEFSASGGGTVRHTGTGTGLAQTDSCSLARLLCDWLRERLRRSETGLSEGDSGTPPSLLK